MIACMSALQHENSVGIAAGSPSPATCGPPPLPRVFTARGCTPVVVSWDGGGSTTLERERREAERAMAMDAPGLSRDELGAGHRPSSRESVKELRERRAVLSAPFRTDGAFFSQAAEWAAFASGDVAFSGHTHSGCSFLFRALIFLRPEPPSLSPWGLTRVRVLR